MHYQHGGENGLARFGGRLVKVNEDAEARIRDIQEILALGKMPGSRSWKAMCNGMVMRYQDTIEANEAVISSIDHHSISARD